MTGPGLLPDAAQSQQHNLDLAAPIDVVSILEKSQGEAQIPQTQIYSVAVQSF